MARAQEEDQSVSELQMHQEQQAPREGAGIDWHPLFRADIRDKLYGRWGQAVWSAFSKFIPSGCKALEVGCGSGRIVARAVAELDVEGYGIDISTDAIAYARRVGIALGAHPTWLLGSGFALPFAQATFGVVLSEGVIEHFSSQDIDRMVAEHVRVCVPGGRVVISVPNQLNIPLTYHKLRMGKDYMWYPEKSFTVLELASLMKRHGLHIVAWTGFAPTQALEWFWQINTKAHRLDRILPSWILALVGYETLVVGVKK